MIEQTRQILEEQLRIHGDLMRFVVAIPTDYEFAFGSSSPFVVNALRCICQRTADGLGDEWEKLSKEIPPDIEAQYPGFQVDGNLIVEAIERLAEMVNQKEI